MAFFTFVGVITVGLAVFAAVMWAFSRSKKERTPSSGMSAVVALASPGLVYLFATNRLHDGWLSILPSLAWVIMGLRNACEAYRHWPRSGNGDLQT